MNDYDEYDLNIHEIFQEKFFMMIIYTSYRINDDI